MTDPLNKRIASATARAALAGVVLAQTTDDHERPLFIAARAELCKSFQSVDDVEAWLDRVAPSVRRDESERWRDA